MFQTKMLNVNNLDIIQNNLRLNDGTHVYVLSQHGLDSAIIYVPPKPPVQVPGKRRWVEQYLWPAIEAFDGTRYNANFVGLVLCKGGGFNAPYEFISKEQLHEDFPLYDAPDESAGPQPEIRNWTGTPDDPRMIERLFEDLEPLGIAEADSFLTAAPYTNWEQTVTYNQPVIWRETVEDRLAHEYICDGEPDPLPYEYFYAHGYPEYKGIRTEQYTYETTLGYSLPGDAPASRNYYEWEGSEKSYYLSDRLLNLDAGSFYSETGGGTTYTCWFDVERSEHNLQWRYTGSIMGVPSGCWYCEHIDKSDEVKNAVLAQCGPVEDVDHYWPEDGEAIAAWWPGYDQRDNMLYQNISVGSTVLGTYDYTYTIEWNAFWEYYASVKGADEFAVVYSMQYYKGVFTSTTHEYGDDLTELWEDEQISEEKSLCVAVDGDVFELFTDPEGSRLQYGWGTKYFQVGGLSIGLFYFGRNISYPLDYQYVYAEVNRETRESEVVVTPFGDDTQYYDSIGERTGEDITDNDGNPIYHRSGYNTYRLIRETVTFEEQL
jgi:hypothetical protein